MFNVSDDDIDKYLDMLSLSSLKDEICCNLSNGEMRRLMLAMSLIKDSPILLLDEPFAGLDIDNIKKLLMMF
ncbi:MAG: ATP-binding cassette domain-containing protein [Clostridium sp.]|nr:MAG: ATP-binding cassette domain-containing protein [Clostridium sp.]